MSDRFKNKVGLVVGGASGMVKQLTQEGCRTHVLDVKTTADERREN